MFPALVHEGELSIGISTGGASPSAAIFIKEQIRSLIPRDLKNGCCGWNRREKIKSAQVEWKRRSILLSELFLECIQRRKKPVSGGGSNSAAACKRRW